MWGMGAWSGSEDNESLGSLQRAIDLGCNFFDTAWAYGDGHSEKLLGQILRANSGKNFTSPAKSRQKTKPGPPWILPQSTIVTLPITSPSTWKRV